MRGKEITKALIIAAGEGKRLLPLTQNRPKALIPLLGLSLIERIIISTKEAGIKDFVIVTGYQGQLISQKLGSGKKYGVNLEYVSNPHFPQGNGTSVLVAQNFLKKEKQFLLLMGDHLFDARILEELLSQKVEENECLLCVDKNFEKVRDLEEATKVQIKEGYIQDIGKNIKSPKGVDCGIFLGSPFLFEALKISQDQGKYTLTDGVKILIPQKKIRAYEVENKFWLDIDTKKDLRFAQKNLLNALISPTEGVVSRTINRKLSRQLTRLLVETRISPNQISFASFLVGVFSALFFAFGQNIGGGLLAQASSILDGVDGEVARLKFAQSRYGAYFESILDRYADALIVLAITYATYLSTHNSGVWIVGSLALIGLPFSMLSKEKYQALTGKPYLTQIYDGRLKYLLAGRDGRLFIIMIGALLNRLLATLVILAIITNLLAFSRFIIVRRLLKNA